MPGSDITSILVKWLDRLSQGVASTPTQLGVTDPEQSQEVKRALAELTAQHPFLLEADLCTQGLEPGSPSRERILQILRVKYQLLKQTEPFVMLEDVCSLHPSLLEDLRAKTNESTMDSTIAEKPLEDDDTDPPPLWKQGDMLGRYQLERFIARGGFGEVWEATDTFLEERVALKIERQDRPRSKKTRQWFMGEARKSIKLQHPGIVGVRTVDEHDGFLYIVAELMTGGTLAEQLKKAPSHRQSVEWIIAIAEGLYHAHTRGLVHRDLKPLNILMDERNRPRIADFGLAVTEEDLLSEPPSSVGTVAYMSPEQARRESHLVDPRADIYALGVILFQALTGRLPFRGTSEQYLTQLRQREAPPLRSIDESIPIELERICLKCLHRSIPDRYTTARDLANDLRNWLAEPTSSEANQGRRGPSRLMTAGILVCLCSLVALAFGFAWWSQSPKNQPPPTPSTIDDDGWRHLFAKEPRKLAFPQRDGSLFTYNQEAENLHLVADTGVLIELGEITSPNFDLRLTVKPGHWDTATCTLFLGYRKTRNERNHEQAEYQIVGCSPTVKDNKVVFSLYRGDYIDSVLSPGRPTGHARERVILPPPSGAGKLELQVRNCRLHAMKWNGKLVPEMVTDEINEHFPPEAYQGIFGIYLSRCSALFSDGKLKELDKE